MREWLLRLCLHAYPRARRARDGEVLCDLAGELSAGRGVAREALGLLRGGLAARAGELAGRTRAPWGEALRRLALPLAALGAAIWLPGAARLGTLDLGLLWTALVAGSVLALAGAAARWRPAALAGSLLVLAALLLDGLRTGIGDTPRTTVLDATLGGLAVDLYAAWLPAAVVLVAAALALPGSRELRPREVGVRVTLGALPVLAMLSLGTSALVLALAVIPPLVATFPARREPALTLAAALALAAWAPEAVWLGTGFLPVAEPEPALALALWGAGALVAGVAIRHLVRASSLR